jgi:hypothetical protein
VPEVEEPTWSLAPNPAHDHVSITVDEQADGVFPWRLYLADGREVEQGVVQVLGGAGNISFKGTGHGPCFLLIQAQRGPVVLRAMIE